MGLYIFMSAGVIIEPLHTCVEIVGLKMDFFMETCCAGLRSDFLMVAGIRAQN